MTVAEIQLPPKLVDVFTGEARYRCAWGGRGSAKTRSFALMTAVHGYRCGMAGEEGQILCAREHLNSLDESSLEEVKSAIRSVPWLASYYEMGEKFIRSKDGRIKYVFAGLRHNVDSIKSKARILLCWVDEAETVSETAWRKLVPTVREEGSEIWVTWNPESKYSATHQRFRLDPPKDAKIAEINWSDNPFFPQVLELERLDDKAKRPDQYHHVWEGAFMAVHDGAYFAPYLLEAEKQGRVGEVNKDPLMEIRAYWDIGGTGARSDATSIWIAQFVGKSIRVLDYYEATGEPLATHVAWLRDSGYGKAFCVLPHDGGNAEKVFSVTYQSELTRAGFGSMVLKNQGRGAAMARINAARQVFGDIWFDEKRTEAGRDALAFYHEKRDEARNIGFGPEHDWASHAADAFGMMCQAYQANANTSDWSKPLKRGLKV